MRTFGRFTLAAILALAMLSVASASRADTPVSACGTLSPAGNYFLTKNLTATGTCIVLGHDAIALDLKGHTITGNRTGDGISDGGNSFKSIAIANGQLRNFVVGVALGHSCCAAIRNLDSSKNTQTGILIGGCCAVLDSVTANSNGTTGIAATGCCYSLNNIVANNNGSGGGIVTSGCCSTVANSTATRNGGAGVAQSGCCNFVVSSTANSNTADGVDMSGCCNFLVDSTVALNVGAGVSLTGDDNLVVTSNANSNGGDGIDLSAQNNQITSSQASGNSGKGASVGCPGAIAGFTAKNNTGGSLTTSGGTCTQLNNKL